MKWIFGSLLFVLVLCGWMFLFPYSAGGEISWELRGFSESSEIDGSGSSLYFPRNRSVVHLSSTYMLEKTGHAAVSSDLTVVKAEEGQNLWIIRDRASVSRGVYQSAGIPFFLCDRLFHTMLDNTTLKEIAITGRTGQVVWQRVLPSSLTSLAATRDEVALGLSMGDVWMLDAQGERIFSASYPEDSLILGVALARYEGRTYLAVAEGRTSAFWHLYLKGSQAWDLIAQGELGESLGREHRLIFDAHQPLLFLEGKGALFIWDIQREAQYSREKEGFLIDAFGTTRGAVYALSHLPQEQKILLSQGFKNEILNTRAFYNVSGLDWAFREDQTLWLSQGYPILWILERGSV